MVALAAVTEDELLSELRQHGLGPVKAPLTPLQKGRHVDLRPHQKKAVEEMENGKILLGGVGTGKSRTAVAYYMAKELGRDIVVITTAKKRDSFDWEEEMVRFGVGKTPDATLVGGVFKIDSWNNIDKYVDIKDALFIFDEQRLVGSGAWTKSFLKIAKQNRWILLSATPGDTWLDYIPVFVANGFFKNRTEFKREHVIYNNYSKFPKVDRYVGVNKLIRLRKSILVQMPYERHTTRHTEYVVTDHDKELLHQAMVQRWHVYDDRPIRDVAELFSVMRKVVNSDGSRVDALREKLNNHKKIIVFYNFDYELEKLRELGHRLSEEQPWQIAHATHSSQQMERRRTEQVSSVSGVDEKSSSMSTTSTIGDGATTKELISSLRKTIPTCKTGYSSGIGTERSSSSEGEFSYSEWNGHKHDAIPTSDRWIYLVQYVAGAEGWNCIETDTVFFYSLTCSYKNFEQAKGRIDRLNTPFKDLNYYVAHSKSDIDFAILKSLKAKKGFNESSMGIKF